MTFSGASEVSRGGRQADQAEPSRWFVKAQEALHTPRWQLQLFAITTYLIRLGLIVWIGFNEL